MAHATLPRWVQHDSSQFERRWKRFARSVGGSWRIDETYVRYLYRAVDKLGKTVDFILSLTCVNLHRDPQKAFYFWPDVVQSVATQNTA